MYTTETCCTSLCSSAISNGQQDVRPSRPLPAAVQSSRNAQPNESASATATRTSGVVFITVRERSEAETDAGRQDVGVPRRARALGRIREDVERWTRPHVPTRRVEGDSGSESPREAGEDLVA